MFRLNRGKKYYSGLLHGVGLGLVIGGYLAGYDDEISHVYFSFIGIVLILIGHKIYDSTECVKTS